MTHAERLQKARAFYDERQKLKEDIAKTKTDIQQITKK